MSGGVRELRLTKGLVALIDEADFAWASQWKWCAGARGAYVVRSRRLAERVVGEPTTRQLHRELMQPGPGLHVDHINGNGLDNRRANLRVCTPQENLRNRRPRKGHRFKGICKLVDGSGWTAYIRHTRGVCAKYLGRYNTAEDAARAYDVAARKLHGVFARLNFPDAVDNREQPLASSISRSWSCHQHEGDRSQRYRNSVSLDCPEAA